MIEFSDVSKWYGGFQALADVTRPITRLATPLPRKGPASHSVRLIRGSASNRRIPS